MGCLVGLGLAAVMGLMAAAMTSLLAMFMGIATILVTGLTGFASFLIFVI